MRTSTAIGALVGSAIDGADGDDSTANGALIGAGIVKTARVVVPIAITFAVGWLVLRGLGKVTDAVLGERTSED
ncbi:MAG: hypothetical protein ABIS51_08055 [Sphingomonas sp.]|jgi:hypothetical protein